VTWRGVGICIVAAVAGSVLVPGSPAAAAAQPTYSFSSDRLPIKNTPFEIQVQAVTRPGRTPQISVRISQENWVSNSQWGERSITYSHAGRFTVATDLAAAKLRPTAAQMGRHGQIDMAWSPTEPRGTSCKGNRSYRWGRFIGTFRFKVTIGSRDVHVRRDRLPGVLRSDAGCPQTCPVEAWTIEGWNGPRNTQVTARKTISGARVYVDRPWSKTPSGWSTLLEVDAAVPRSNVKLDDEARQGHVRGSPGTYLKGSTDYVATAATTDLEPVTCSNSYYGDPYEMATRASSGALAPTGDQPLEIVFINRRTSRWTAADGATAFHTYKAP
jgi:hypothetical protein